VQKTTGFVEGSLILRVAPCATKKAALEMAALGGMKRHEVLAQWG